MVQGTLSTAGDKARTLSKIWLSSADNTQSHPVGPSRLVNPRLQITTTIPQKPRLGHWHTGCKRDARREATTHRINGRADKPNEG